MMFVSQLSPTPAPQNRTRFELSHYYKVPAEMGCYVITSYEEHILYIGQSVNLQRRFEEHLDDPRKLVETPFGKSFWFYWHFCDKNKLSSLERGWTTFYEATVGELPIMNSQSAPI